MGGVSPGVSELVRALLLPESYPHRPELVEMVQTRMSLLFLTGKYVYKVKKPVNLGYVDYTTLESRNHFCRQEVALNRRLSPDVYLGVVNIVRAERGLRVEGEGEAVEYAVKMLQLPGERMMDVLLPRGEVSLDMVRRVSEKMARFHQQAETGPHISAFGEVDIIAQNNVENFEHTLPYVGRSISQERFLRLRAWMERCIREKAPLFQRRVQEGRIRDCHGDLHSAHVCFTDSIVIYDCIEFNERFRYGDVASEVAFLAMDIDHKRQPGLGKHWVETYTEYSRDAGLLELIDFYKCYRAHVRGKVEAFKLDDPNISQKEKEGSLARSRRYFELAWQYSGLKPVLVIMTGLVGTGKSTVAEALGRRLGLTVVSSDVVRKEMAGVPAKESRFEPFGEGIYSAAFSERTYGALFRQGEKVLDRGESVVLDASFKKAADRRKARGLAREKGVGFLVVECRLGDDRLLRERLDARVRAGSVSDGRWELVEEQRKDFDRVTGLPDGSHVVVDTIGPVEQIVDRILAKLAMERNE